jgi:hypothetical protein
MKSSRAETHSRVHSIPDIRYEDQSLTSCSGLVLFQVLFQQLRIKDRLRRCLHRRRSQRVYGLGTVFMLLVVHIILGYRRLRDLVYYHDDPMVLRALGLSRLPDVATLSRNLRDADATSCDRLEALNKEIVLDRIACERLRRLTLDIDGSVCSTRRYAEGTASGFNKQRKGARSYYPLLCTVAQTGQALAVLHRPGNVHDSNGSPEFIASCVREARTHCPGVAMESRLDSAFFSETTVGLLGSLRVEFAISVPFERLVALKDIVENRHRWCRVDDTWSYFELWWKPKSWGRRYRFLFVRQRVRRRRRGAVQLDLFEPREWEYAYKVIVTNKIGSAATIIAFHHGRGSQEGIIGEMKASSQMDYIPSRRLAGNRLFMLAAIFAHNLTRELQMRVQDRCRSTTRTRRVLWVFEKLSTLRNTVIRRAGRLTRPNGRLTLTMSVNDAVRQDFERLLAGLQRPA